MKNITAYIGNLDRDLGALRRDPERFLASRLDPKVDRDVDGLIFGHMETDTKEHEVVCVNRIVLDIPVSLDVRYGRHTGFHEQGPKAGKAKGVGPKPTVLEDGAAQLLLEDVVEKNRSQMSLLQPLLRKRGP